MSNVTLSSCQIKLFFSKNQTWYDAYASNIKLMQF